MLKVKLTTSLLSPRDVERGVRKAVEEEIYRTARDVETLAKELVPVVKGNLQASIHLEQSVVDSMWRVMAGGETIGPEGEFDVTYAEYVEWGTSRMEARPYLRPAVNEMKATLRQRLDAIDKRVTAALNTSTRIRKVVEIE